MFIAFGDDLPSNMVAFFLSSLPTVQEKKRSLQISTKTPFVILLEKKKKRTSKRPKKRRVVSKRHATRCKVAWRKRKSSKTRAAKRKPQMTTKTCQPLSRERERVKRRTNII